MPQLVAIKGEVSAQILFQINQLLRQRVYRPIYHYAMHVTTDEVVTDKMLLLLDE